MAILVDTNVLLRALQLTSAAHATVDHAIRVLLSRNEILTAALQNMAEFWNTATRPRANNGLGLSTFEAEEAVGKIETLVTVLDDNAGTYSVWKDLVIRHGVRGVQVHDARLVAVMKVHGVRQILSFNVRDFARYPGIEAIHPSQVA